MALVLLPRSEETLEAPEVKHAQSREGLVQYAVGDKVFVSLSSSIATMESRFSRYCLKMDRRNTPRPVTRQAAGEFQSTLLPLTFEIGSSC
jgi:hypothetical protein